MIPSENLYPVGVIHGRFQPLHNDHVKYILAGMKRCSFMVVGITNPDPSLTRDDATNTNRSSRAANPCTYYERMHMVRGALVDAGYSLERFCVVPFPINVPELWYYYLPRDAVYFLTIYDEWGERKAQLLEGAGLRTEIMWRRSNAQKGLAASEIRQRMIAGQPWEHLVPPATKRVIEDFGIAERIRNWAGDVVKLSY